jgi:hypothetical protein
MRLKMNKSRGLSLVGEHLLDFVIDVLQFLDPVHNVRFLILHCLQRLPLLVALPFATATSIRPDLTLIAIVMSGLDYILVGIFSRQLAAVVPLFAHNSGPYFRHAVVVRVQVEVVHAKTLVINYIERDKE